MSCITRFAGDQEKSFFWYDPDAFLDNTSLFSADLALSLDVIYHLVEDVTFHTYMRRLFRSAQAYHHIFLRCGRAALQRAACVTPGSRRSPSRPVEPLAPRTPASRRARRCQAPRRRRADRPARGPGDLTTRDRCRVGIQPPAAARRDGPPPSGRSAGAPTSRDDGRTSPDWSSTTAGADGEGGVAQGESQRSPVLRDSARVGDGP